MNVGDSKYYNLIINVSGKDSQCEILSDRIKKKERDVDVVILDMTKGFNHQPTESEINAFKKINPNSRILILAHTAPNSPYLGDSHFKIVAEFFGKLIAPEQASKGKKHLKISILGCQSGKGGQGGSKSFAGLFHRALKEISLINSRVTARNEFVSVTPLTRLKGKTTSSFLAAGVNKILGKYLSLDQQDKLHVNKKAGSKTTFKWDVFGNQIAIDSYLEKFTDNVFFVVDEIQRYKKNMKKENETLVDKSLVKVLNVIGKLKCEERLSFDYKMVAELVENLSHIRSVFEIDGSKNFQFITEFIKKLVDFSNSSIDKKSEKFKIITMSKEIVEKEEKIIPVDVQFKNLLQGYLLEKRKLPKSDREKLITDFFIKFEVSRGKLSWDSFSYKSLNGMDLSIDIAFYKFLFFVFKTINSDLSKEDKKKLIEEKFQSGYKIQIKNNHKDLDKIDLKYKKWMKEFFEISIDYVDSLDVSEQNININETGFEEKNLSFIKEKEELVNKIKDKFELLGAEMDFDEISILYNELSYCYIDCLKLFGDKIPESLNHSIFTLQNSIKSSLSKVMEHSDFQVNEHKENIAKLNILRDKTKNKVNMVEEGSGKSDRLVKKIESIEMAIDFEELLIFSESNIKRLILNAEENFSEK